MALYNSQKKLGMTAWIASGVLFFYFATHLWFASQGKEFWMDETDGLYYTIKSGFWQLISEGSPQGQGSRSPLSYLFDRAWIYAWNDRPLLFWDLRLFFRVLPVAYWSAANTFLLAYLWRYFWREKNLTYALSGLFAFAIAQFSYTNNFGSYYAIESRSYSLWVASSMLHFLGFWQIIRSERMNKGWGLFLAGSLGLVLTTYASLTQIFLVGALLLWQEFRSEGRLVWFTPMQKRLALNLGLSLLFGAYYYSHFEPMHFPPAPLSLFGSSLLEVLLKAFHHHNYQPAFVSFPFLFLFVPFYWRKRSPELAACCLYALLMVINAYLLYLASLRSGGIFASRYVIYALPSLTFLYLLGVFTLVRLFSSWAGGKLGRNILIPVLALFAAADAAGRPIGILRGLPADLRRFQERHSFARHDTPACAVEIPHEPWDFESVNNNCRGITGHIPENFLLPKNQAPSDQNGK